jgi:hypothetical protein
MTTLALWNPNGSTGTLGVRGGTVVIELGGLADGAGQSSFGNVVRHLGCSRAPGVIGRATEADAAP